MPWMDFFYHYLILANKDYFAPLMGRFTDRILPYA